MEYKAKKETFFEAAILNPFMVSKLHFIRTSMRFFSDRIMIFLNFFRQWSKFWSYRKVVLRTRDHTPDVYLKSFLPLRPLIAFPYFNAFRIPTIILLKVSIIKDVWYSIRLLKRSLSTDLSYKVLVASHGENFTISFVMKKQPFSAKFWQRYVFEASAFPCGFNLLISDSIL